MILATDVQYADNSAKAAGVVFSAWDSKEILQEIVKVIATVEPYQPGKFYRRELPCIVALLAACDYPLDFIVIDGYVTLGAEAKPGLGMLLYESLNGTIPVIGVAKKEFIGTPEACKILRGNSQNPLYISAAGVPLEQAKSLISGMHGKHRIPTVLKKVDQLCRGINA